MKTYFEDDESRKIRVHQSHCCFYHGCKYGDTECPVLTGRVEQLYPCEDCDQRGWKPVSEMAFFDESGTMTGYEFEKAMARVEEVKASKLKQCLIKFSEAPGLCSKTELEKVRSFFEDFNRLNNLFFEVEEYYPKGGMLQSKIDSVNWYLGRVERKEGFADHAR